MRLFMLDTNMVSYILSGRSAHAKWRLLTIAEDEQVCISSVTEAELLYGLAKMNQGERRRKLLEWFLSMVKVLPWDTAEAVAYSKLRTQQESLGKTLSPLDTMIAAHAIAAGATLVTNDKAFLQIATLPGIENWAIDLVTAISAPRPG